VEIKSFNIFSRFPELVHGMSNRKGGISRESFESLNLGLATSDDKDSVYKNRERFFGCFGLKADRFCFPEQVHSDHVEIVMQPGSVPQTDALITNQKSLFLTVQTADCFPVFLYDPRFEVVALVHSGWRGTAGNIVRKTIRKMQHVFGCSPATIMGAVGAGIQGPCYQVDDETASHFDDRYCQPDGPGHFKLDLQAGILDQLRSAGLTPDHLEWDTSCTHCERDTYYSYRRDGVRSGRMMAVIGLR
jgi:YfiH family protein